MINNHCFFLHIFLNVFHTIIGDVMKEKEYLELVKEYTPSPNYFKNESVSFLVGGLMGLGSEFLLEWYQVLFHMPRKESGVLVILTLILVASFLTALGFFDVLVSKVKSGLIIPITGFAHSMTSAALEYRSEGFVLGIGASIFKLAGSVILYGVVAVYFFGLIRLVLLG